jgi:hypothetical protein
LVRFLTRDLIGTVDALTGLGVSQSKSRGSSQALEGPIGGGNGTSSAEAFGKGCRVANLLNPSYCPLGVDG